MRDEAVPSGDEGAKGCVMYVANLLDDEHRQIDAAQHRRAHGAERRADDAETAPAHCDAIDAMFVCIIADDILGDARSR